MDKMQTSTKIIALIVLLTAIMPLVSANLGTFKTGECVDIKTILNASWVNISTISYPNSSLIISNVDMSKNGQTFNYTFCDTSTLGTYTYDYFDSNDNVYVNDFLINTAGVDGNSTPVLIAMGIALIVLIGLAFACGGNHPLLSVAFAFVALFMLNSLLQVGVVYFASTSDIAININVFQHILSFLCYGVGIYMLAYITIKILSGLGQAKQEKMEGLL
jgi:hypothetical protein